ncbi:MAG: hypothetical protein A3J68_00555 [Candidatus Wildermuthbacteria bacterium RIFCSPHIGHO2_02_FULL_48_16]|uniref:Band 7 domain-containing protein n=1 Tax=Candidatus Wildermuthbacteria bacterium RIFCSPHIGHO2_02_FULL_48_16 TaxID=1802453 RepID=A0A1G2R836_9BACT|nr:MAG: hypothetical protein A3J68_00555 [Candidatus Wildermuthbacteria bacterium RIFCSPHIGHO2_02_FULL_48_16]
MKAIRDLWSGARKTLAQVRKDAREAFSIAVQETKHACPIVKEGTKLLFEDLKRRMPGGNDIMEFLPLAIRAVGIALFFVGIGSPAFGIIPWGWGAFMALFGLVSFFVSINFRARIVKIRHDERAVIERFGNFDRILGPGLNPLTPGIETIRAVVKTPELFLPLFEQDKEDPEAESNKKTPVKIDFKDGSATPKGAGVFIRLQNPEAKDNTSGAYKAIYEIDNWRRAIPGLVGPILRSYLNSLTIDDALAKAKGGYNLLDSLDAPIRVSITDAIAGWGFTLIRIVIEDFALDDTVVKAREEVLTQQRQAAAAEHEATKTAWKTGGVLLGLVAMSTGKTTKEVQQELSGDPALKQRFLELAQEFATRQMSIEGKALTHVRVDGSGGLEQSLITILAAVRGVAGGSKT